ncbi:MAG TPA: CooT family nickel-binding protein [Desulfobulbus sp.]|nr:CooT family nickel-binding protein [Desulfobulbus sp.]
MCQISAIMEEDGREEIIMEGVTALDVTAGGILLTTFFEEPKLVPGAVIRRIDFLGGRLILARSAGTEGEQGNGSDE